MALDVTYCLKCADAAAVEASEAKLDNVRERALRSEAAWRTMARRQQDVDRARKQAAEEKARASAA